MQIRNSPNDVVSLLDISTATHQLLGNRRSFAKRPYHIDALQSPCADFLCQCCGIIVLSDAQLGRVQETAGYIEEIFGGFRGESGRKKIFFWDLFALGSSLELSYGLPF